MYENEFQIEPNCYIAQFINVDVAVLKLTHWVLSTDSRKCTSGYERTNLPILRVNTQIALTASITRGVGSRLMYSSYKCITHVVV